MTEKELRKLKRTDLLEVMIAQSKEIDRLQAELAKAQEQLAQRELAIQKAGSIAEASLEIFQVLENTQKAADLYLENVKRLAGAPGEERS